MCNLSELSGQARETTEMDPTSSLWLCSHYFFLLSKSFKLQVCRIAAQDLQAKVLFIQFVSSRISFPVWKNKNQLNSSTLPSFLFMVENFFSRLHSSWSAEDCERSQGGVFEVVPVQLTNSPGGTIQRKNQHPLALPCHWQSEPHLGIWNWLAGDVRQKRFSSVMCSGSALWLGYAHTHTASRTIKLLASCSIFPMKLCLS